jgi:hypothetical protein
VLVGRQSVAVPCQRGWGTVRTVCSAGMGDQADDRQFAVGCLLVAGEAGHGGGDLPPGLLALGPVELFGGDGDLVAGQLDPDLVGMGGQVAVPGRVPGRPGGRGDDQPAVVLAGEPADRRLALEAALAGRWWSGPGR